MNILSYHVYDGHKWLADDECSWTSFFPNSASFNDPKLAQDIGQREVANERAIYVMACMGTI